MKAPIGDGFQSSKKVKLKLPEALAA